jgi:hypothetical protein
LQKVQEALETKEMEWLEKADANWGSFGDSVVAVIRAVMG